MSLDLYLYSSGHCNSCGRDGFNLFHANITHNLSTMADKAGIYEVLWHPNRSGIKLAKQLIPVLHQGLINLKEKPEELKVYEASNGYGTYEGLVNFVEKVLKACQEFPESEIEVSI